MKTINVVMMSAALALGALATGCQSTTAMTQTDKNSNATIPTYKITNTALQANDWQLVDAKTSNGHKINTLFAHSSQPLTLSFNTFEGNNIVNLKNTCNNISAPYTVKNGEVKLGNLMSTMIACPDEEAKFDTAAVASIVGKYTLSRANDKTPMLVITNNNQVAHFQAVEKSISK